MKGKKFDITRFDLIIKRWIRDPNFRLFVMRRILRIWKSEKILDSYYTREDAIADIMRSEFDVDEQLIIFQKWVNNSERDDVDRIADNIIKLARAKQLS